jgi:hypothetical protein
MYPERTAHIRRLRNNSVLVYWSWLWLLASSALSCFVLLGLLQAL